MTWAVFKTASSPSRSPSPSPPPSSSSLVCGASASPGLRGSLSKKSLRPVCPTVTPRFPRKSTRAVPLLLPGVLFFGVCAFGGLLLVDSPSPLPLVAPQASPARYLELPKETKKPFMSSFHAASETQGDGYAF
eukprot:GHVT01069759.1.p1 GENE.GHVT01069759.1~~GHVT01069759.1.p1  ORF type:complete len:133 (+),score=36.20 GHVT01069759.1:417-815(+)